MQVQHEDLLHCSLCNYKCEYERSLKAHVSKIHTNKKSESCEFCDLKYSNKVSLRRHNLVRHALLFHQSKLTIKKYNCEECEKGFNLRSTLKVHVRRKHLTEDKKEKLLKCEYCIYRCEAEKNLKAHCKKMHSDFKPESCKVCDSKYSSKNSLRRHTQSKHSLVNTQLK